MRKRSIVKLIFVFALLSTESASAAWLSGWENRVKITISNTNADSDLSHYPRIWKQCSDIRL